MSRSSAPLGSISLLVMDAACQPRVTEKMPSGTRWPADQWCRTESRTHDIVPWMQQPDLQFTRWDTVRLFGRQFGLAGDIFLAVVGAGMFGLSAVVFMDGFGLITKELTASTSAMLGGGLVIAVIGLFALGVASEGPLIGEAYAYPELELTIGRAFGVVTVSLLGLAFAGYLSRWEADFSYPFVLGVGVIRSVALAGLIVVLPVVVPVIWYLRRELPIIRVGWDRLIMLMSWIITAWVVLGSTI